MKICTIIKCGHTFCEKCILDWINLHNKCPSCKFPAKKEDIMKNFIIEEIKNEINLERSKEEQRNIEDKFSKQNDNKPPTEIEKLFFDGLKSIFTTYENFFKKLEQDTNKQVEDLLENSNYMNGYEGSNDKIKLNGNNKYFNFCNNREP